MTMQSWETSSETLIEIRSFHCPACANLVYEMTDHEVGKCVHCGEAFHGEIDATYEPERYRLVLDPKTGVPRIDEDPNANAVSTEELLSSTCPGCGWPLMP